MRIFPEGTSEGVKPVGQTFCILSAFAAVVGIVIFFWQFYIWHQWPRAQATVIESRLVQDQGDQGEPLCSAAYRVQYYVDERPYTSEQKEKYSSDDCKDWQHKVEANKGAIWTVVYDREHPNDAYINPGFNLDFFFAPAWCMGFAAVFAAFGVVMLKLGGFMARRRIELP